MQPDKCPANHKCSWCGKTAIGFKMVQRQVIRKKKGIAHVISPAEFAPACRLHMSIKTAPLPTEVRARSAAQSKVWKGKQEKLC